MHIDLHASNNYTMEAIRKLREAAQAHRPVHLEADGESTDSIRAATHVRFGDAPERYALDAETAFYNDDQRQPLRAVVFCWTHDKLSIVDYKNACLENGVPDFKFLVKAELTTWLSGSLDSCKFIRDDAAAEEAPAERKRALQDPQMERIGAFELAAVDHNAALRGSKNLVLKSLVPEAKRFAAQLKRAKTAKHAASAAAKKQPIVIVSPATTALLSLSNIKEFLEEGRFVEPARKRPDNGVVIVNHPSDRLAAAAQLLMVVDNVDLFTKPEYWDRVVAIFTTGQAWQFAKYKYSKPEALFQRYAGFYVAYTGDIVPKHIHDWNVNVVHVDHGDKRFRDKMIVKDLWAHLERILLAKDYGA